MQVKTIVTSVALATVLTVGSAFAQATPPPQNPPAQPPATPPAGQQPPAEQKPAPQPPKPFPEGAKVGFIDLQVIASNSVEGKAATAQLQDFLKKKNAEIAEKAKQTEAIDTKLKQGGTVLSEQARAQAEKDLQKLQREVQNLREDAQQEHQDMTQRLQAQFQERLNPVIEQIATEKGLYAVFSIRDSGIIWGYQGIDLSAEVIKRFDAAQKSAPKK